jgi:phosphotransferase system  glucose/maltose/N-acetylglucosamine-specific IIC component
MKSSAREIEEANRKELVAGLKALPQTTQKDYLEKLEKQAETFLQEQLKAAIAITQRAVTLAAILGAVIAALTGVVATLSTRSLDLGLHYAALVPLLIGLICALVFITGATLPDAFYYAGSDPVYWRSDISRGKSLEDARAEQIGLYSAGISANDRSLGLALRSMKTAFLFAAIGLAVALCAEFVIALSYLAK